MKNNVLWPIASIALLCSCSGGTADTTTTKAEPEIAANSHWNTMNLIGMVKTIEESPYTADSLGVIGEMDSCCIEVRTFNEKGYLVIYAEKDSKGTETYRSEREYLEDGKWQSATNTKNGRPAGGRTVVRDENGEMLYAEDRDSTGALVHYFDDIKHNELDQPLEGTRYRADSTFTGRWTRSYTDGKVTGWGWSDSTGTQVDNTLAELNDQGWYAKITKMRDLNTDSATTKVYTYTYDTMDEVGNWTQRTEHGEDGKVTEVLKRTFTYFDME